MILILLFYLLFDSVFQIIVVGLLVEFMDLYHFFLRNAFLVEKLVDFLLMHTISFILVEDDVIMESSLKDR